MRHLSEAQLTLVYYREAEAADQAHLEACSECRSSFVELARLLDAVRAVPIPEKGDDYERRLWLAMEPRVSRVLQRRGSGLRYWMLAPGLAVMLAVAFVGGMYTQHRFGKDAPKALSAKASERVLLIALGDHMDRSQIVLAELVNAPEGHATDISSERQLAGSLVSENRLLRQTAAHNGDRASADVLDDLERILLDVAHSPSEVSSHELDEIRQRIQDQGLLFKIRVLSTNAREKGMKL